MRTQSLVNRQLRTAGTEERRLHEETLLGRAWSRGLCSGDDVCLPASRVKEPSGAHGWIQEALVHKRSCLLVMPKALVRLCSMLGLLFHQACLIDRGVAMYCLTGNDITLFPDASLLT